jgi:hypothetical protein
MNGTKNATPESGTSDVAIQEIKRQKFLDLAERLRRADDPEEISRLGEELGRMIFG